MCSVFFKSYLALLHLAGGLLFILWRYIPLLFCSLSHDLLVLSFSPSICVPLWRTQLYLYHTIPGSSCRALLPQALLLCIYPTPPLHPYSSSSLVLLVLVIRANEFVKIFLYDALNYFGHGTESTTLRSNSYLYFLCILFFLKKYLMFLKYSDQLKNWKLSFKKCFG